MDFSLKGKRALVCGASQGIGRQTALMLAENGADLTLVARSEDRLKQLLGQLPEGKHNYIILDLIDTDSLKKKLKEKLTEDVQILVCNSGGPKGGPLLLAEADQYIQGLKGHVIANNILVSHVLEGMKKANYGRITNIISTSVKAPIPNLGVSNTIRGAVASWSKTLSLELAQFGITVNNVLPGYTQTPRLEILIKGAAERLGKTEDEVIKLWKAKVPMGRFAKPEEVAAAVLFLSSPMGSYISGINLPVDGGRTPSL